MQSLGIFVTLSVLLAICLPSAFGAEYYVSNAGDDSNPGTSPSEAWRTLSKVNGFKLAPGDVIRFEKGGVWRGQLVPHSGSEKGPVTYTAYGSGNKPLFLGSVEKNDPADWTPTGENLWSAGPLVVDVGNIIFNNGEVCGIKVWNEADLDKQNEFWYDANDKLVKLYSSRNPAEMFDDIECALKRHIINQGGRSYVVYDGLHLAYGAAHGIGGGGTHHVIIRNCDLCFIGGGHQFSRKTKRGVRHVRYGNGIEFWNSAHDNTVENCRIWDIYDAGVTNQGSGKNEQYNLYYRNNTIWNCEYSFEYWNRPATSITHDIYFENNLCFNAGRGWSHKERPWAAGIHLMFFDNSAQTDKFYIRNNVFHRAEGSCTSLRADRWSGLENLVLEENVYWQPLEKPLVWWGERSYSPVEFEAYRKQTGKDSGSKLVALGRIALAPRRLRLSVGGGEQLKVTAECSHDVAVEVTRFSSYSSSDGAVASIEETGLIRGLRPGEAVVTVTFEGLTATAAVTVDP